MKSSTGVLATQMLAALAGYASAQQGTCGQKTDGAAGGPVTDGECQTGLNDGKFWAATGADAAAVTCILVCDMAEETGADKAACCTGTPWTIADAATCGDGKLFSAGTATADSTCVNCLAGTAGTAGLCANCEAGKFSAAGTTTCGAWTTPDAATCGDAKLFANGTATADSTCVDCEAGTAGAAGLCPNCEAGTFSAAGATTCTDCEAGKFSAAGDAACVLWTTASEAVCKDTLTGTDEGNADGSTYTWTTGTTTKDAICGRPCVANALVADADGAGDCDDALDAGASCFQTMTTGFCTASSCTDGELSAGTCTGKLGSPHSPAPLLPRSRP
jgi:syndecan 4